MSAVYFHRMIINQLDFRIATNAIQVLKNNLHYIRYETLTVP